MVDSLSVYMIRNVDYYSYISLLPAKMVDAGQAIRFALDI
jgi:hypothetical protein